MKVRYSLQPFGEIEILARKADFGALLAALEGERSFVPCHQMGDPRPYEKWACALRIRNQPEAKVSFSIDEDESVVIDGDHSNLAVLAVSLAHFAQDSVPGEHLHIESLGPDHFVSPSAMSFVVTNPISIE